MLCWPTRCPSLPQRPATRRPAHNRPPGSGSRHNELPGASTMAWTFVVRPPRLRPGASLPTRLFFGCPPPGRGPVRWSNCARSSPHPAPAPARFQTGVSTRPVGPSGGSARVACRPCPNALAACAKPWRAIHSTAFINRRLSPAVRPTPPALPARSGASNNHVRLLILSSSFTNTKVIVRPT